jgi:hypothetical protein
MARTAKGQVEVRFGKPSRIFEMLGKFPVALCAGKGSVFLTYLEELNLLVTLITGVLPSGGIDLSR